MGRDGLMRWAAEIMAWRAERFWSFVRASSSTPRVAATAKEAVARARVVGREFGGMVNVKMNLREGYLGVKEIRELGVARVSLGPELWKCAMKAVKEQAELLLA